MHPPDTKKAQMKVYIVAASIPHVEKNARDRRTPQKCPPKTRRRLFTVFMQNTHFDAFWGPPQNGPFRATHAEKPRADTQNTGFALETHPHKLPNRSPTPKMRLPHPHGDRAPKKCPGPNLRDPCLKTVLTQGQNRPKWGLLEAVWALLTPRTGCGREKTRFFAKKSKMTLGNPLRHLPNKRHDPPVRTR